MFLIMMTTCLTVRTDKRYLLNGIDQNDVLFEDLPKPEFAARDKCLEKLSTKIKPNKRLVRLSENIKEKHQKQ